MECDVPTGCLQEAVSQQVGLELGAGAEGTTGFLGQVAPGACDKPLIFSINI